MVSNELEKILFIIEIYKTIIKLVKIIEKEYNVTVDVLEYES